MEQEQFLLQRWVVVDLCVGEEYIIFVQVEPEADKEPRFEKVPLGLNRVVFRPPGFEIEKEEKKEECGMD